MSRKLIKQIQVELEQLDSLMKRHPELLRKGRTDTLTEIEIDALAALLHSFYTGVENIFKRVSIILGDGPPTGEMWHIKLLNSMVESNKSHGAVISQELCIMLRRFLEFRHVFRHAYSFELQWGKMAPLVAECLTAYDKLREELDLFIAQMD